MFCYNCGCQLSEYDFCTACGADVGMYKKIMYASNRYYNEGLEKAQIRDLSGAVVSLRQSLKFNKNNIEARNLLGLVYFELGEAGVALSEWVISQNHRPEKNVAADYISQLQNSGNLLDDMSMAIHKYNQAVYYCTQGSIDLAAIQLKGALSKNKRYVKAHLLLALIYMAQEDWEKAGIENERAISVDHNNTQALLYKKNIEKMLEPDEEDSRPTIRKKKDVVKIERGNDFIIQPANVKEPKNSGAATFINILIGLVIGMAAVYFLVVPARVSQVTEESQASIKEIGDQLDSKNESIKELESQVESLQKDNSALNDIVDSYSGDNGVISDYEWLMQIASDYIVNQDIDAAAASLDELKDSVDIDSQSDGYRKLYDSLLSMIGPELAGTYYDTGLEAYNSKDYDTAIEQLTRAYYYNSSNDDALFVLANAYRQKGNYEEAATLYEELIEKFPDTERATKSQQYLSEITAQ